MKKVTLLAIILMVCLFVLNTNAQQKSIDQKVDSLLSLMTLKEKAGQMLNIGLPAVLTGDYWEKRETATFDQEKFKKLIVDYAVGSIHNTPGYPAEREDWYQIVKKIQDSAMTKTRLKIPVLYGIDDIHGANYVNGSVLFPHQIAVAATWNTDLSKICGEITSYESRAASLPWNFNPNVDVAMNPLWGRISESFGEDPYLISEMADAYIKGSQGKGLQDSKSTAVCLKHFVGYAAGKNAKDRASALIPENSLRQYYLPTFEKAIKSGAMGVMISSNAVNGIPCHINKYYITDILKGEMGFKGVVISDFSDIDFLVEGHLVAKDKREATKMAVNAGLDMIMNPFNADVVDYIVDLAENGEIPMGRIDDAVSRVLHLKFELNLFKVPYNNPKNYPDFASKEHIAANYKTASEAITLLKNKNNILPLSSTKKVLVTGYSANSINVLNGAWSRSFLGRETKYNDPTKQTILDAVRKQVGATNVEFVEGTDYLVDINTDKAVEKAKDVDYVVVCVGEIPASEKPSDINELQLPEVQQELIKKLSAAGKPIILVMVQGRSRIIREVEPFVDAIVMGYYPGEEGGRAISDVLFGKINPSGKLPYTYPKYTGNAMTYYYKKTDIKDADWGYNGFYPQFEFGFGMSYTTYEYSNLKINSEILKGNEELKISIDVKNTGSKEGKEIVEVYTKDLIASVSPDCRKLVRFAKINLKPGETKTVNFSIKANDLAFIGMENKWITEEGEFELQVGGNPQKLLKKIFNYKR
ncbi:MAG: glycoside hydrolase family 3 N-terminal domain-containing protein [Flavobacterium sp.]|uniref:glycoside hydrolase family 3 N-terminal domain-containing protein n=1 Tax=Flavobacterium sp. TaxID=239 RepID=UPI00260263DE|nr:glycoside hydrolase family 3 N-terminal domain-containing protein [Flavobacterium sp.]MDD5149861.1 glycoside hydrolase family 3 N-terminal domain-containing protein [Flavobacterium sp.]